MMEARGVVAGRGPGTGLRQPLHFCLSAGRIGLLMGPNGSGKSSLLLALAGLLPLQQGTLWLDGRRIDGLAPAQRRALGLALVPEGHAVLPGLTVHDNLRAAGSALQADALRAAVQRVLQRFPELQPCLGQNAGTLSGGQRKLLALAQALVCGPRYLLLDEPMLALAPPVVRRLQALLPVLRDEGIGLLLAEPPPAHALQPLADQVLVLRRVADPSAPPPGRAG